MGVSLVAAGSDTLLTLRHERFPDEAERANHEVGWTRSFARLVEHAAAAGVGDAPA